MDKVEQIEYRTTVYNWTKKLLDEKYDDSIFESYFSLNNPKKSNFFRRLFFICKKRLSNITLREDLVIECRDEFKSMKYMPPVQKDFNQILLKKIQNWFQRRYLLSQALITFSFRKTGLFLTSIVAIFLTLIFLIFIFEAGFTDSLSYNIYSFIDLPFCAEYGVFVSTNFLLYFIIAVSFHLAPRLISGTIIGYTFLIFAEEMWRFACNQESDILIIIELFSVILSISYFYLKLGLIRDILKRGQRAFKIVAFGFFNSFIIGYIYNFIFGSHFFSFSNTECTESITRYFRICNFPVCLNIILFWACTALFFGVFVQLLWDDRPVTEPI
jgi:hypothetical protein